MRTPKRKWVEALRALTGQESDDIRWNEALGRWEFVMVGADNIPRSQFWGWFNRPIDPVSGLHPHRELTDQGMVEALANLEKTFVGNPFDGAGTTRREVMKRIKHNRQTQVDRWKAGGQAFADMTLNVGGRGARLRGSVTSHGTGSAAQSSRRIEIPSVIGGKHEYRENCDAQRMGLGRTGVRRT